MEKIKIGFTGTQGTGKTTAVYEISTELKKIGYDVNIITEAARSCPLPINEASTIESQLWILAKMMERELESTAQISICDRTVLDVLAYTSRISPKMVRCLQPFIKEFMKTYDIVFYMDINEKYLIDDGTRSTNKLFQKQIKEIIDNEINILELNVSKANTKEERMKIVNEVINRKKE